MNFYGYFKTIKYFIFNINYYLLLILISLKIFDKSFLMFEFYYLNNLMTKGYFHYLGKSN